MTGRRAALVAAGALVASWLWLGFQVYGQFGAVTEHDMVWLKLGVAAAGLALGLGRARPPVSEVLLVLPGSLAVTFMVLVPGVLAIPWTAHFYPAAFGANLLLACLGDGACEIAGQRARGTSGWPALVTGKQTG